MNTWIIASSSAEIATLVKSAGEDANLVILGNSALAEALRQTPVAHIFYVATETIAENYAEALGGWLAEKGAETILAADLPTERALATAATARLGGTWISAALAWNAEKREATRLVAARAEEQLAISGPVGLVLESSEIPTGGAAKIEEIVLTPATGVELLAESPRPSSGEDISAAERVIGVGRGIAEKEDLQLVQELAAILDAKVGATRPLAEGYGWFDSYIGLTGQNVNADLYLAIGLSGQIHHSGGVQNARIIVAINDDPQAPIFAEADYGIVGDLYEIVPALTAALQN